MSNEYRFLNPYNFVRYLPAGKEDGERDVKLLGRCTPPPHDRFIGLTGRIECELEAATPIFISDSEFVEEDKGKEHKSYRFFRLINEDGEEEFAIPSTSLRGMLRSVFEAATNSCFSVFEGGLLGKRERPEKYDRRLPLKAGRIREVPESEEEYGIVKSMSHYKLPHNKFRIYENKYELNGNKVFVKIGNERVFDVKNKKDTNYIEGYLKTSDKGIPGRTQKRNEYVFVADSSSEDFILPYEPYQNYIISNRNNSHEHTKVPKVGNTIWFRADEEQRIKEFGYAQIYRKPFKKSIGDLLPKYLHPCSQYTELCPACRVFGWVHQNPPEDRKEKVAYAGRVKISHAKIIEYNGTLTEIPLAILSTPKPTTRFFYLLKNGRADPNVAYGTDGAELRGRKFYRHQEEAEEQEYERTENVKDKQNRTIRDALKPGAKFRFTIRFENLSQVEFGALLWSVEMEEGMHHKLGLAKPLGFGSVKLSIRNIKFIDFKERYISFTGDGWRTVNDQKKREWLDLFKAAMKDRYSKPFEELNNIRDIKAILSAPPSDLPVHYPRISEEPEVSGENFRWFMKNKVPLTIASEDIEAFSSRLKMMVSHITLKNWRNFRLVDVEMGNRVFIVGPTASGKSNFLDVFRFLRDIAKPGGGLQKAISDRGGMSKIRCLTSIDSPDIEIEVALAKTATKEILWRYAIGITQADYGDPYLTHERVWVVGSQILDRPADADDELRLTQTHLEQISRNHSFREISDFFNSVRYLHLIPQLIRYPGAFSGPGIPGDPYGQNFLKQVSETHTRKSRLKKIEKALRIAVPQLKALADTEDESGIPHLEVVYEHWKKGARQREDLFSDGTLRLIGLLWALLDEDSLLLLEEPELSLNIGIISKLPALIYKLHWQKGQVILSTHSADLLSDRGIGGEEVLLLVPGAEGTEVKVASSIQEIRALLEGGLSIADAVLPGTVPPDIHQMELLK